MYFSVLCESTLVKLIHIIFIILEQREANRAENAAKAKVRQEEVQKKLKNLA